MHPPDHNSHPFGPLHGNPSDDLWIGDVVGVPPPARPHSFRIQGPGGQQGLGWTSHYGPDRSHTRVQFRGGAGFNVWQIGNLIWFQ